MDYFFALNIYLRRIFRTNVMFSIAIILKRLTIKDVPMIIHELLNIKACSFHVLEWGLHTQSLVASCKYWVAPLISTRVSDYCQVILLKLGIFYVSLCTYFGLHFRKPVFFSFAATPVQSDEFSHSLSSRFRFEPIPQLYLSQSIVLCFHL